MQNFKEHIILKLAVIFLTAILVFPSIVKLSHSFENHKHEVCNGEKQTHIHTKDIDCSLCDPECPVDAIVCDDDLTSENKKFLEINERLAKKWPVISEMKAAPPDAKIWENKKNKINLLEE